MPRVAVIGCGDVSIVHFEAIAAIPDAELVAVGDRDPVARAAAESRYGVPGFADHRGLISAVAPDVIHICTPHDQHAEIAVDSLTAGVAVLQEKPLAESVAEGMRIVRAAEEHSAKVGVCFQNRYNATAVAIRDRLDSGVLGPVLGGSATVLWHRPQAYYAARPWRGRWATSGGGVMINQAIHTLDLLLWFLGDATAVRGHVSRRVSFGEVEVEDTADLVLDHVTGARSVMFASSAHTVDSPVTLEIVTEEATLYVRGDLTVSHADGRVEVVPERVLASGGRAYWGASHQLLVADFYARLGDDEPFWIGPREAAKSLRVLDALYAQSGITMDPSTSSGHTSTSSEQR